MDTKYGALVKMYPEIQEAGFLILSIQSECLKPCAEAFSINMRRGTNFAFMPAMLTHDRIRDATIRAMAEFAVTGKLEGDLKAVLFGTVVETEEMLVKSNQLMRDYANWTPEEMNQCLGATGVMVVEDMATRQKAMAISLEALYTSLVLEAWLFFETLCADVWVAAVDNGGRTIINRVMANTKWDKGHEREYSLHPMEVESNAKTHPGSFFREIGYVSFQRKRSIFDNYLLAFDKEIMPILKDSGYLWALHAFRCCITHSCGKVDKGFKSQVAEFEEFRDLPSKSDLPLNGEIVAKLRNAALTTGAALLKKVDEILLRGD